MRMFILETCPHCNNARRWMQELCQEDSRYQQIEVELIDEQKQADLANSYDYYYVPTIYIGDKKVHEGIATKQGLKDIFDQYLKQA